MSDYAIEMVNISKWFGAIRSLDNVSFSVRRGEVHALLGENESGKSTLMKILSGAFQQDAGQIRVCGQPAEIRNPQGSQKLGIGIVHQKLVLAPDLSVVENVFLGALPPLVPWSNLRERARLIIGELGYDIEPSIRLGDLPFACQQVVEIANALSKDAQILVLDEPSARLMPAEVQGLLRLVRTLGNRGVSVIYMSHQLEEIFQVADSITVLKEGRTIGTIVPKEITSENLVRMMACSQVDELFPGEPRKVGEIVLSADRLRFGVKMDDVSFEVRAGEILGIAGLVGAGRPEVSGAIFGAEGQQGDAIAPNGGPSVGRATRHAVRAGIELVPEVQKDPGMPVHWNATMPVFKSLLEVFGLIKKKAETVSFDFLADRLGIKMRTIESSGGTRSDADHQKVLLSKWFGAGCRVIFFDEPTRGADAGAKAEIYRLINELASEGLAVVLISSDLVDVIALSDRMLVMSRGRIAGELKRSEFSEENIMRLAL